MSKLSTFSNVMSLLSNSASSAASVCKGLLFWKVSEQEYTHAEELMPVMAHLMAASSATLTIARLTNGAGCGASTAILTVLPVIFIEYSLNTDKLDDKQKTILLMTAFSLQTALHWLDYRYNKPKAWGLFELLTLITDSLQAAVSLVAMGPGAYTEGLFADSILPDLSQKASLVTAYTEVAHAGAQATNGLSQYIYNQCVKPDEDSDSDDEVDEHSNRSIRRAYLNLGDNEEHRIQIRR